MQKILFVACVAVLVVSWQCSTNRPSTNGAEIRQSKSDEIFAAVPAPIRARLVERFDLLIEYRRSMKWDRFSSLLSLQVKRGRSTHEIIRDYKAFPGVAGSSRRLVSFRPQATSFLQEEQGKWIISGCATLSGVRYEVDAFVVASRENEDWVFSDIDTVIRDRGFKKCRQVVSLSLTAASNTQQ
jgi:hypothetical protein